MAHGVGGGGEGGGGEGGGGRGGAGEGGNGGGNGGEGDAGGLYLHSLLSIPGRSGSAHSARARKQRAFV